MIVMVSRTFVSKVRTADHIVFKPNAEASDNDSEGSFLSSTRSFGAKVGTSLKEDHSMFAWADKGQWESVETADQSVQRERNWFRIGFEPIFVDFTGKGSWFVVYSLVEVRASTHYLNLGIALDLMLASVLSMSFLSQPTFGTSLPRLD